MGISSSNNRRRVSYQQNPSPYPVANPYYYYPSEPYSNQSSQQGYGYPSYPPPLPAASYPSYYGGGLPFDACNYVSPVVVNRGGNYGGGAGFYNAGQMSQWGASGRVPVVMAHPAPPYVEHQNAKRVRSCVNVHKESLRLVGDELNPGHFLVAFVFDALQDGSITIQYFAKEEPYCRFIPLFPEACPPLRISFHKGLGQSFRQPPGTGINLGFFEPDDLSKPSPAEDVFPLVISAETYLPPDDLLGAYVPSSSPNTQITQAVFVRSYDDPFQVRVTRQILWIDGVRYELRELYGIGNAAGGVGDSDSSKDCVICMTEPKDTAVLPCRHMCMCSECAKELRLQSDKCPICRQPIEELLEIKISDNTIYQ
uniref:RING-type E3 ubiquitin transferase n=1 Tax=Kalanchoe fedtschenkoi TaxID=63787 RepID=A0A7N0U8K5_KALFE